jgi:hypothetical protein
MREPTKLAHFLLLLLVTDSVWQTYEETIMNRGASRRLSFKLVIVAVFSQFAPSCWIGTFVFVCLHQTHSTNDRVKGAFVSTAPLLLAGSH